MKIWAALFLVLITLCGCTPQPEPEWVPPETVFETATVPTEPAGFYVPGHPLEESTDGALKVFPLGIGSAEGIRFLGDDIVLFSGYENTKLTLLTGQTRSIKATAQLPCPVSAEDPSVIVDDSGVTYVDYRRRELVFLDTLLEETGRISLPAGCQSVGLSADRRNLYYCTADALRVMELDTGLDRLIKQMSFLHQELTALHCGDEVVQCSVLSNDENWYVLFFDAETGALLYEGPDDLMLWTRQDLYLTAFMDGEYRELIVGSTHFGPSVLVTDSLNADLAPVLSRQGLILLDTAQENTTQLDYYDLYAGTHPYSLTLPGTCYPVSIQSDPESNTLWFLCYDSKRQQDLLCAWNLDSSGTADSNHYLQPRYTRDAPDEAGLARCAAYAEEISRRYGVQILIGERVLDIQPLDYTFKPEHQVPLIRDCLEQLAQILSVYPEGMLHSASQSPIRICLVRSIANTSGTAPESVAGIQFWDSSGAPYVAVTPGANLERHVHHELFHVLDSRVLSTCSAYDVWDSLNPKDFSYDYDYLLNQQREDTAFTAGDSQHFIDLYAMSYPKEDRARIMEFAILPGQAYRFESTPMQNKLRQLCLGLREAFGLPDQSPYPWEQYLKEPLA